MSYALPDPFYPFESDASRLVLEWAVRRYEFARRFCRPDVGVADVGCGAGFGSPILRGAASAYWGIDHPNVIAQVVRRGRYPSASAHFVGADLDTSWPVLSPPPGLIVAFEVIEHLQQPVRLLTAIRSTLLASGTAHPTLLLSTPINPDHTPTQKSDHLHEFSLSELAGLLASCEFRVCRAWSLGVPFGVIARLLARRGRSPFRAGFEQSRGLISRLADQIPLAGAWTYARLPYSGSLGDWGITMLVQAEPGHAIG